MIFSIIAIYQPQKTPDHDHGFGLNDHDHHFGPNYHCFDDQLISRPVTLVASPDASPLAWKPFAISNSLSKCLQSGCEGDDDDRVTGDGGGGGDDGVDCVDGDDSVDGDGVEDDGTWEPSEPEPLVFVRGLCSTGPGMQSSIRYWQLNTKY